MQQAASARARRRRARRMIVPEDAEGQAGLMGTLARRAHPTFELFLYSIICGAVLGLGFLLDSQPILLLGALLAPLMTPWLGMLLALIAGSGRFLFETFMALLISALLVFLTGLLTGFAARLFMPLTMDALHVHTRLWLPELAVLVLGAALLAVSFVRSEARPFLPSVIVAYAFFLPLNAAGFGLGAGVDGIWPQGVLVFLTHFALAGLVGIIVLMMLKLKPTVGGLFFTAAGIVLAVAGLVVLMGGGVALALGSPPPTPAPELVVVPSAPTPTASATLAGQSPTARPTSRPAGGITPVPLTLEVTLPPSETPTITMTFEPTPVLARIRAEEGGGAVLRQTPAGQGITVLENFTIVQVLPETEEVSGWTWSHIIADQNGTKREGWVLEILLDIATPVPTWVPTTSATPAPASTP